MSEREDGDVITNSTRCARCGHVAYSHRLDDAKNVSPADPEAKFRCIWPGPDVFPPDCDCPDFDRAPR